MLRDAVPGGIRIGVPDVGGQSGHTIPNWSVSRIFTKYVPGGSPTNCMRGKPMFCRTTETSSTPRASKIDSGGVREHVDRGASERAQNRHPRLSIRP